MIKGTVIQSDQVWLARLEDDESHTSLTAGDTTQELARARVLGLWARSAGETVEALSVQWEVR